MFDKAAITAAGGTAFGVILCRLLPKEWALWKEAVAVAAVCTAVYAVLAIVGRRQGGDETPN